MKTTVLGAVILLMISAFAFQQPEDSALPPTITYSNPEYDETYDVVTYGASYYVATANAFCSHQGQGSQAGYSVASGSVDGTYAWYQTSWYIGHDEGGKRFTSITCFTGGGA